MADDWQAGDLALCVRRHDLYPAQVRPGAIFTVTWVWLTADAADPSHIDLAFDFEEVGRAFGDNAYWQGNFRKIAAHEPDAEDRETIDLLNRKPVGEDVS